MLIIELDSSQFDYRIVKTGVDYYASTKLSLEYVPEKSLFELKKNKSPKLLKFWKKIITTK